MITTKEVLSTSIIENTEIYKVYVNNIHIFYYIRPSAGYVLHDSTRDWIEIDPDTLEETYMHGYSKGMSSCRSDYDFNENKRNFYTELIDNIPAEQIF